MTALPETVRVSEQPLSGRILDLCNAPLTDVLDELVEWRTRYVQGAKHWRFDSAGTQE